ncbi:hypothetical protein HMPREF0063_10944 [Aeromicrobium marinum DSM 15272]|uniref:Uncharacterized protein n=1 Tax=Aeromicrobium marinum DSM 15272 TaxID=585531 RepID=E2SAF4_9ACTN|nr:M50 family metallopeptidase [Aeromicrobium marinum]EFQ84228.1 hypothetical protein HMPREF0063_10944 [Aeromicrobium marinum DSM 15272]
MTLPDGLDGPQLAAVLLAAALVLVPGLWHWTRHAATLVHETGHAAVAVLTGRRLTGIRLHADTSGLTVSRGRPRGPGMIATAAAGYPAPSVVGLALALAVGTGRVDLALWIALGTLVAVVVHVRNLFGLLVVVVAGGAVVALVRYATVEVREPVVLVLAWFLLLAGPRTVVELWGHRRRRRSRTTDADVLARLTRLPAGVWNALLLVPGLAAVGVAAGVVG